MPLVYGQWYRFVVQIRQDYRLLANGGQGKAKVWTAGETGAYTLRANYVGPVSYNDDVAPAGKGAGYLKIGNYSSPWRNTGTGNPDATNAYGTNFGDVRVQHHDAVKLIMTNTDSFNLVAP